jgi:uncharacterized protein with von Willebrand factor type A (vWA) domain
LEEELPLLDFFYQLRNADLQLGIGDYRVFLRALQLGYGSKDDEDLRRLCHALWTKSLEERRRFDYHFDLMLAARDKTAKSPSPEEVLQPAPDKGEKTELGDEGIDGEARAPVGQPAPPLESEIKVTEPKDKSGEIEHPALERSAGKAVPGLGLTPDKPAFVPVLDDEVQMARTIQAAFSAPGAPARRYFIIGGEYFPVTRRQMKQNWRYLRRLVKDGPKVVLNVEETVRKIGRDGLLLEPVLEPVRHNCIELLLLVDQDGSMVPFHSLARRLVETAQKGGRLGRAGVYYFHDCPQNYLYLDPEMITAAPLRKVLSGLRSERTVALIFSDAGAARGGDEVERAQATRMFLEQLRKGVRRVAWLNPMPESRWRGSTAADIAAYVPMFEFNRRGMDAAIDLLRGRLKVLKTRS